MRARRYYKDKYMHMLHATCNMHMHMHNMHMHMLTCTCAAHARAHQTCVPIARRDRGLYPSLVLLVRPAGGAAGFDYYSPQREQTE